MNHPGFQVSFCSEDGKELGAAVRCGSRSEDENGTRGRNLRSCELFGRNQKRADIRIFDHALKNRGLRTDDNLVCLPPRISMDNGKVGEFARGKRAMKY